jgi:hypothetical protein
MFHPLSQHVSTPFLPNGSRYKLTILYLLKLFFRFQHLFFLMEVATWPLLHTKYMYLSSGFQHLFFLMEVATVNTSTREVVEYYLEFQHLFFLMEVATKNGLTKFIITNALGVSTPFLPNGSRYSQMGCFFQCLIIPSVSTPFLPNGSRYPSIVQPRYSNQSRRRLRGSEKPSPQTPISPTSKPP